MKTKSTLEKAVKFVTNCKIIFSQRKNIFQKSFFGLLCFLITSIAYSQSGSCNSEITIDGENQQKYNGSEVSFLLQVKNTGTNTDTYQLSAENFSSFAENPDGSATTNNVLLNNRLESKNNGPQNKTITLAPGEVAEFYVKLSLVDISKLDQWNGTSVTVTSTTCPGSKSQTILHTFIPPKKTKGVGFYKPILDLKDIITPKTTNISLLHHVAVSRFYC
ncbi:Fn3 domain-containing protein [Flavobacterium cutihirudinis]|uniref:Fn3 domain-containing protein n=1 Tax=Flavobacterium cutihirudinis TaxID=1265740 RepID=A0A3D9FTT9_9FLAO|nr:Fn3-like domain-containing protein [Flavobacterium cutihirudinis]RED23349.1 Fn3 domain-containing protein [Flavobacterium cutihirudinis]